MAQQIQNLRTMFIDHKKATLDSEHHTMRESQESHSKAETSKRTLSKRETSHVNISKKSNSRDMRSHLNKIRRQKSNSVQSFLDRKRSQWSQGSKDQNSSFYVADSSAPLYPIQGKEAPMLLNSPLFADILATSNPNNNSFFQKSMPRKTHDNL